MSNGWNGADPTQATDAASYELGTEFLVNQTITITAVRVWSGASPGSYSGRQGRIWTNGGALLGTAAMPTNLPSGWQTYNLATPLVRPAGSRFVVSFSSGGNYGTLPHGLDSDVVSADGAVTAVGVNNSTNGNGVFTTSPTSFPTRDFNNTFYGIDVVYSLGGGSTPPTVTNVSAVQNGNGQVASAITATGGSAGLTGATYNWSWGDGTTTTGQLSNTATHTYANDFVYPILAWVTDTNALSGYGAACADIELPASAGLNFDNLIDAVLSKAATLGIFETVAEHDQLNAPTNGINFNVLFGTVKPARGSSGLAATSVVVLLNAYLYRQTAGSLPLDQVDKSMVDALSVFFAALTGAYTLGGLVRKIDLLGEFGTPLTASGGYADYAGANYRVIKVGIPLVVDDVWQQVA
ncbi:MAG TPA: DUF4082 domain-containing protein [Mycobacterium sp.]|nr:DUF4082 domain-containing protein [Mycobacterium sp.]